MRAAGEQNHTDLLAIIDELNKAFAASISFVYLPGDNADHGDVTGYAVVRHALDQLALPWCAILGDHDVEQKSFANFRSFLAPENHYAFTVGDVRYLALNAFDVPEPPSFTILPDQLAWIEEELGLASSARQTKVLLLHCYPSDLKQGRDELARLVADHQVKLIDMGHTHYNEVANDGRAIYTATRSTGQIEEGPVGFSVTNLDQGVVSWRFLELGRLPAVVITSPADERLLTDDADDEGFTGARLTVRAKVWNDRRIVQVKAVLGAEYVFMAPIPGSGVWEAKLGVAKVAEGVQALSVVAVDADGRSATDEIHIVTGAHRIAQKRSERDQENVLEAWPEHGLLGTQLGPNKNGRKW